MAVHIGINGFGRLGRVFFRASFEYDQLEVTAINDPIIDLDYLCYLINFDSTHGNFKGSVQKTENGIVVNGRRVQVFHHKKPQFIPWYLARVDYVIEASGMFSTMAKASLHLEHGRRGSAGVRRVIVTASSNDVPVIILGVNHDQLSADMKIISCASSTLYCLAPLVKLLDDHFGVLEGMITSVHAMTPTLKPLDGICPRSKHWRDHRGALQNIIPAATGACRMLGRLLPHLEGKLTGIAYRVPVVNVSVLDLNVRLKKSCTLSEIKKIIDKASQTYMKHIIRSSQEDAVSSDFLGDKHSCILDMISSIALNEHYFKLVCWYENEYSYACRIAEVIIYAEYSCCRPLSTKENNSFVLASQEPTKFYDSHKSNSLVKKTASFIIPLLKTITNKPITSNPFRRKSLSIYEDSPKLVCSNNGSNKLHNASKQMLNFRNSDKVDEFTETTSRFINKGNKDITEIHRCKESDHWMTALEFERDLENKTDESLSNESLTRSDSFGKLMSRADSTDIKTIGGIIMKHMSSIKYINNMKMDISISSGSVGFDFGERNSRELSENDVTNQESLHENESKLMNRELIFEHERNESPALINESFINEMLTVTYSADSTAFEGDDYVYYIGEPLRERAMRKFNVKTLSVNIINCEKICQKIEDRCSYSGINKKKVEDILDYVNNHEIEVPSIDTIEMTAFKSRYSILNFDQCICVPNQLDKTRKLQLCDKVDSSSDTDSNNSFQINEKKSIEIKMSDVTDSLEDLEKIDKICRIIEISNDLSDNLFKKLDNMEHKSQIAIRRWSLKEFCERISFDKFFKSTFQSK